MQRSNLILIGGGGHAQSCIDVIEQISGEPMNQSSVKAAILETTKKKISEALKVAKIL